MVEISRLDQLRAMTDEDPEDEFTRYALALEYKKLGRTDDALREFDELIRRHPDYVPAYQMAGQYLAELHRGPEAAARLRTGIEAARRAGDSHAAAEMQDLLELVE